MYFYYYYYFKSIMLLIVKSLIFSSKQWRQHPDSPLPSLSWSREGSSRSDRLEGEVCPPRLPISRRKGGFCFVSTRDKTESLAGEFATDGFGGGYTPTCHSFLDFEVATSEGATCDGLRSWHSAVMLDARRLLVEYSLCTYTARACAQVGYNTLPWALWKGIFRI